MASRLSQQNPDAELQAAFRQHLPQRLRTLLRRARAQCRGGWDVNVLRSLHDEISQLAGACGRYGMLEAGERLLALESALAPSVEARQIPDAETSARIDGLLDSLRPHLQQTRTHTGPSERMQKTAQAVERAAFPRCEVPPDDYWMQLGIAGEVIPEPVPAEIGPPAEPEARAAPAAAAPSREPTQGPCVRIVNDDAPIVNELLLRLDQQGCDVALLEPFDKLLDTLRGTPPDLVILVADANTPFDRLAPALRETRANPVHHVRLLALLRNADVDLRLRALRAGADKCVVLPAESGEVIGTAMELAAVNQESPYRVLIVDDDAPQALFAEAILRRAGMETRILGESLPVLEELDRFQPDLLLLDLNMPDCDGFELTTLIRERENYVNTPIVFLSGDQDEDRQFAALDAGGDDFLTKPIRPAHLIAAVTNRVRRARSAALRTRRRRRRDAATGLHERSQLLDALSEHLATAAGHAAQGGLLIAEVRDAAALRQHVGAAEFDRLLAQVGEFIVAAAGAGSMTARHGEAGYLIFTSTRDESEMVTLANALLNDVSEQRFGAQASAVRLHCAVCAFDATLGEAAAALAAAARTLDAARTQPGRIAVHSALTSSPDTLGQRIESALAAGSFNLVFQPVIPIRGAAKPHYQTLLRLRNGQHEYQAAELIPEAVRAGKIAAVDTWVVEHCIGILAKHRQEGEAIRLFASQSLQGWDDPARRAAPAEQLATAGVEAKALVLEFRCEEARADVRALSDLAEALRQTGVRVALAGVDATTLAAGWLDEVPLDYVKLAPDLEDADLAAIVQAAHSHNLRVIAPRIETVARATLLRDVGVDLLQGNYFQPPSADMSHALPAREV
jgi:PleD family two-component response regulator/EAL domain-containing protein (putative c-di-GMP-specific phosphodiesterase class I)